MLTDRELSLLYQKLNISKDAQKVIETIRSSPPSRRVGSNGKNMPVEYVSKKMGVTIQAESYKVELAGAYEMDHNDPEVLEFYDQPPLSTSLALSPDKPVSADDDDDIYEVFFEE